jgi:hypothetical protein
MVEVTEDDFGGGCRAPNAGAPCRAAWYTKSLLHSGNVPPLSGTGTAWRDECPKSPGGAPL